MGSYTFKNEAKETPTENLSNTRQGPVQNFCQNPKGYDLNQKRHQLLLVLS